MGIINKPAGVTPKWDTHALVLPWPVTPLYAGWYGSNLTRSKRDLAAPRRAPATVVGTPSVTTAHIVLSGSTATPAYMDVDVDEPLDLTAIVALSSSQNQADNNNRTAIMGWPTGEGFSLYGAGENLIRIARTRIVSGSPVHSTHAWNMPSGWAATPRLLAVVRQQGVGITAYDLTAGTSQAFPETETYVGSTSAFRFGSRGGGPFGTGNFIHGALVPAAMTPAQLAKYRTMVAARAAALNGVAL